MLRFLLFTLLAWPAAARADEPAAPTDWSKHMGKLSFAIGYERGMKEVAFTGKPPMLFFTSAKDPWCPKYAARTFTDPKFLACVAGYTPILIDADLEENAKLKEKYTAVMVPALVWVDFDGETVFVGAGDAPLDIARKLAEIAQDRAPEPRKPGEGQEKLAELRDALRKAAKGKAIAAQVEAIAAVRAFGAGAAVQLEADALDRDLWQQGEERLAAAQKDLDKHRKSKAKSALGKLVKDYGEHPIGQRATTMLAALSK